MSNNNLENNYSKAAVADNTTEISLMDIFKTIKNNILWIILVTLITTLLSLVVTRFFITPKYTASIMVYVYNEKDSGYTSSDITLSKSLVNTYVVMLESDTMLNQVINSLNLDMNCAQLRKIISASAVNSTEVFKIYVEHPDPRIAKDIADALALLAPDFLTEKAHAGSVEIVDYAQMPVTPTSPSLSRNMLLGLVLGLVASVAVFVVISIFDTKVHDESDVINKFDIPVLGGVPNMVETGKEA